MDARALEWEGELSIIDIVLKIPEICVNSHLTVWNLVDIKWFIKWTITLA